MTEASTETLLEKVSDEISKAANVGKTGVNIGATILVIAVAFIVIWGLMRLNRYAFKRVQKKHKGLHLMFFERLSSVAILIGGIILVFSFFGGMDSVWKTLLGGTAIVSGVLAFAAQDVIKDILAGMMISMHKPFEVGNRIELENGTIGIVKDMSMRHVVLLGIDTQYYIIPNSKLNVMQLRNFSYHTGTRSADFNFYVAYGTDVEYAMKVLKDTIIASPLSVPGKETAQGREYAEIYFMAYEESALRLRTTVYYNPETPSEKLINDINLRVDRAFREHHIEIPFKYVNVIEKKEQD